MNGSNLALALTAPCKDEERTLKAALYARLSCEDTNGNAESISIESQRFKLARYADENGISVYDVYVDDGYSGTSFDRPGFQRMISDIKSGFVNCVIVKDLSRFGRNYILTGHYVETVFLEYDVKLIAIDDNFIADDGNVDDMFPFKNVVNEFYAKLVSRSVKSMQKANAAASLHKKSTMLAIW